MILQILKDGLRDSKVRISTSLNDLASLMYFVFLLCQTCLGALKEYTIETSYIFSAF